MIAAMAMVMARLETSSPAGTPQRVIQPGSESSRTAVMMRVAQ